MKRIQLTNNLNLDEYIPRDIYMREGFSDYSMYPDDIWIAILKRKLNPELIRADQKLRELFGPVIINNWWHGGEREYSGFRPVNCSVGSQLSDHREGNASDKIFQNYPAQEVRDYIKKHHDELGITLIEANVNWVHSAVSWIDNPIKIVYP